MTKPAERTIRIGVLGCGNVGAAFVTLVARQQAQVAARTGVRLEIGAVAVRNLSRERDVDLPAGVLTRDAAAVVADPTIDLVVEMIGGIEPARELITTALRNGKPVVTANKELLANIGAELFATADECGVDLLFEAAVAGGIPVVRALRESLRGEPVTRIMGIINGTTNYILTKMTEDGADYSAALADAQALGFAERDPTADVEGYDAGAKAAIMATIAFGAKVVMCPTAVDADDPSAASPRTTSRWRSASATSSSCSASPSSTQRPVRSRSVSTRRWCR